jgi:copper chaperone CopZ
MTAVHAARAAFTALTAVDGIRRAEVTVGRATIEHDGRVTRTAVAAALAELGYEVLDWRVERRSLRIL